jgi:hypothetical protein
MASSIIYCPHFPLTIIDRDFIGGGPEDTTRGFSPHERWWRLITADNYAVIYGDNGGGYTEYVTPLGQKYVRVGGNRQTIQPEDFQPVLPLEILDITSTSILEEGRVRVNVVITGRGDYFDLPQGWSMAWPAESRWDGNIWKAHY